MRQAIETRYLPATGSRGSRIKATSGSGLSKTVPWDHAHNQGRNHRDAAEALARKLGWGWGHHWAGGGTRAGYAFVDSLDGLP